jgi:cytochrome c553
VIGKLYEYRLKAVNSAGATPYTNSVTAKRQDRTDIKAAMLVNNCASCHGTDGYSSGTSIPSIAGLDKTYLIRTMKAYRTGERASSVMSRMAKGYTDTQIERMADYLSKLSYKASPQVTIPALVSKGKAVHESNCMFCHTGTGNNLTPTRTLLEGQWATYLHATLEDYYAGRSSNMPAEMGNQMAHLKDLHGEDVLWALAQYYAADAKAKAGGLTDGGTDNGSSGNTTVAPTAPSALTATTIDNTKVNLSWKDTSNNETGFKIERRRIGESTWSPLSELSSNTQSYIDTTVTLGTSYDYQVLAFNTAGSSNASTLASITLQTLLQYGQQQYQRQGCASCHGADGSGGFTNLPMTKYSYNQLSELTRIIHDTMPPGNAGACQDGCASAIATYITEVLTPNANNNGSGNTQVCTGSPPAGERSLRLLTRQEYQNTVNDLLGLQLDLLHKLPEENRVDGFDNNVAQNQITSTRLEAFLGQAEQLASQAVLQSWNKVVPCTQQDTACGRQFVQTLGKRAYRRPLSPTEVDSYMANFSGVAFKDAVEQTIMGMLMSPHFLYRSELGVLQAEGTYQLTPYEVASSLSYLFWGTMPDDALLSAADQNALATPQQRITQASRLLAATRSRQQVGNFVGQWLLKTNPYFLPPKDGTVYPAYTDAVRLAMSQELINFFNYVVFDSTQTFRELYQADYVIANKTLADFYKLTGATDNSFVKMPVADGSRSGLLTLGAVLARYANSNESHPFKRGRFFFERILCHDLPEPANMGVVEAPDPDPNMTTRERFLFHSNSGTSCFSCHQYLDGPGFSFENYDGAGQFRRLENGNIINASGVLRGMETYTPNETLTVNDLAHLSTLVADSPTAAQCVARQYYRYATGRRETAADSCALNSYLQTYQANGYNLQTMLLSIVNAPNFTLRRAP